MGWGRGENAEHRAVGYLVVAECDQDDCERQIDRGLAYVCGGMHDGGEQGCGGYFCDGHLFFLMDNGKESPGHQLCPACSEQWVEEQQDG